ncbi:glycosyltransferase [Cognatilysobacter terrigena]|uniref:glycosyltransferase n=1 Tax=Cognatilysobacter terrigena TaxID=2488749 RepID=UPI00105EBC0C|nr:glycosyltransferase [Lysobacter terrigena]
MLSFVVPAHDEAPRLPATLEALHAAAVACGVPYEIVVVDDASRDGTADVARACGAHVVRVEHRHIAATRNAGARAAGGPVLVFVDADTLVPPGTVAAALAAVGDGAVGGGGRVRFEGGRPLRHRIALAAGLALVRLTRIAPGCFLFCTREAFVATGGFDERWYAGEDVAMSRALAKVGRFVLLREPVWTSARKLETFSPGEHLVLLGRLALRGRRVLRSREHLRLWYERREKE